MDKKTDLFSSSWTYLLAALGMAIGAGNLWRFPRLAGQYGGSFLIPWIIFLFLWSIPLIVIEFSLGKKYRLGLIGVFRNGLGKSYTWMGWFIAICTTSIMFYYSVVCGWSLKYFFIALSGKIFQIDHNAFWSAYTTSNTEPVLFHLLSILFGAIIIYFGIKKGIEKAVKVLLPLLFLLIILSVVRSLSLPGAQRGLWYFFHVDTNHLLNYKVWLEALSQSAWSTGAGWGLILTYANYVKEEESAVKNAFLTGLGNNLASVLCGLAIIPAVFALSPSVEAANEALRAGNQGLTFIYLPQLFFEIPGRAVFTPLFFFTLFIAAISSLIAMIELAVKVLMDYGLSRQRAVFWTAGVVFLMGIPSAYSLKIFNNQDWVWGLGLLLSGFFYIVFVLKKGISNFLDDYLKDELKSVLQNLFFARFLLTGMLVEFLMMILWWFVQSMQWYPQSWWDPLGQFTIGTCLFQWILVILAGIIFNDKISEIRIV